MPENIIQIDQNLLETRLDRLITEKMTQILNAMLVGLGVEHGVDGLLDLDSNQSIELGLEHGVVELYDFIGHGFRPSFQSRFSCVSD